MRRALWPLGFPVIIIGGIYGGIFSPTEAAAVCVPTPCCWKFVIFKSLKIRISTDIAMSTGLITAVVFILVAAGEGFSWIISFAQIPQPILGVLGINEAGPIGAGHHLHRLLRWLHVCRPDRGHPGPDADFRPSVEAAGLDPVLVGILITLQVAIGSATPPFGCDIFTAIAIFKRPYLDVIKGTPPFIFMLLPRRRCSSCSRRSRCSCAIWLFGRLGERWTRP